jgi:hypothetical protein
MLADFPLAPSTAPASSLSLSGSVGASSFPPAAAPQPLPHEDVLVLRASVENLRARVEQIEREKCSLQSQLASHQMRSSSGPNGGLRAHDEVEKLKTQVKFLEHEKQGFSKALEVLTKEKEELKRQVAQGGGAPVKSEERPLKRVKEEPRVKPEPRAKPEPKALFPAPVAPAPVAVVAAAVAPSLVVAAPIACGPAQDFSMDCQQTLIKKLYAGSDIFELLQQQHSDKEELLRVTRDLAVRMSTMMGSANSLDGLALVVAQFLRLSPGDRVAQNALGVLATLLGTVPQARAQMLDAMVKLARTSILPVTVNEAEPWTSLVSVLIGHVAQSVCSDGVVSLLLACFSTLALDAQASLEALQAFLPLFSATSDFAIGLVNAANANCGIGVEFLASVIRCPEVYAAARQGRSDGVSVLSCASQLLSRDVQGKHEAVLSLRRSLVKLFSVIVATYPDWDTCTTAVANGCDFGPRLVNLLFELIQHLKRESQDLQLALATGETFLLLVECNKKPSVGIAKVFHQVSRIFRVGSFLILFFFAQLFIGSLVALSGPLHPALASLQPLAAALLREGQLDNHSGLSMRSTSN